MKRAVFTCARARVACSSYCFRQSGEMVGGLDLCSSIEGNAMEHASVAICFSPVYNCRVIGGKD